MWTIKIQNHNNTCVSVSIPAKHDHMTQRRQREDQPTDRRRRREDEPMETADNINDNDDVGVTAYTLVNNLSTVQINTFEVCYAYDN